jgi:agmatine/peptidylarginine deiminase
MLLRRLLVSLVLLSGLSAQSSLLPRVCAEWEPALGTLIAWPTGLPQELVVELARDDKLFVLVTGASAQATAATAFAGLGIDPAQVVYITAPVQSWWPRDWGPHQIFDADRVWTVVDPIFQGYPWVAPDCVPISSPGGHVGDDMVNAYFARFVGAPDLQLQAYLTGGNFLVDGQGSAFSTCAMVGENNQLMSEGQFLSLVQDTLGIERYYVLDSTENHGIQHIDCWMKVIDEETLLVKRAPVWHEEYERLEANVARLEQELTCYGRPYKIVRIDCPPYNGYDIAAYTNSLILNGKAFVPLFGIPGDARALETFAEVLPGYEVIGFTWGSWYYYDALHCRTRAVFDPQMLRIAHPKLSGEVPWWPAPAVTALVQDYSGAGLVPGSPVIRWRLQGEADWRTAPLEPTGEPERYAGALPVRRPGLTVEYYLAAESLSGRAETMPATAPAGFYVFTTGEAGPQAEPWAEPDPAGAPLKPPGSIVH